MQTVKMNNKKGHVANILAVVWKCILWVCVRAWPKSWFEWKPAAQPWRADQLLATMAYGVIMDNSSSMHLPGQPAQDLPTTRPIVDQLTPGSQEDLFLQAFEGNAKKWS